ncbi:MAG: nuclear transport factor 2 family protein [Acidobacteriota bacterium]
MLKDFELLTHAYTAFNTRDIDAALTLMHPEVDWPNGMEGGRVYGHSGVRDYWTRQWSLIDPYVEPQHFETDEMGRIIIDVHQVVRDLAGNILVDQMVQHIYLIEDGLIKNMEIKNP